MTRKWVEVDFLSEKGLKKKSFFRLKDNKVIERTDKVPSKAENYNIIKLKGVVTPSILNAHTHLELTERALPVNRSLSDKELWDWIIEVVRIKRTKNQKDFEKNINRGERYLLKKGIDKVLDIRSVLPDGPLFYNKKLYGLVFYEVLGYQEELFKKKWQDFLTFFEKHGDTKKIGLSIHSLYTTPPKKAKELIKFARANNLKVMIHMGEKKEESEFLFNNDLSGFRKIFSSAKTGRFNFKSYRDIMDYLDLAHDCILVHCTQFEEKDFEEVKKRCVKIVVCPRSNLYFTGKLPQLEKIIALELRWAIGSDSLYTNKDLNVLADGRLMVKKFSQIDRIQEKVLHALTYGWEEIVDLKAEESYLYFDNTDIFNSKYRYLSEVLNEQSFSAD